MAAPRSIEGAFLKSPWWLPEILTTCLYLLIASWFFVAEIFHTNLTWESISFVCQTSGLVWLLACATILNWTSISHELGHAIAASLVGYPVHYIQIGFAPLRKPVRIRLLGYNWSIYSFIRGGGFVSHAITSAQNARIKMAWIIASGPLVDIFILGLLIFAYVRFMQIGSPTVSDAIPNLPFYILNGLLIYHCLHLARGLIPMELKMGGSKMANDGRLLLQLPSISDQTIQSWVETEKSRSELSALNLPYPATPEEAMRMADMHPNNATVLYYAATVVRQTGDELYLSYLRKALNVQGTSSQQRVTILDEYLTGLLENGLVSTDLKADELSLELVTIHEDKITALGTRGGILIDLHRLHEGEQILKEVIEKSANPLDRAYSCTFLALAEKQKGNLKLAHTYAREASRHNSSCAALKRVSEL